MMAHELARQLLAGPNYETLVHTVNGLEPVDEIFTETSKTTFHHIGEENIKENGLVNESNEDPGIILCSESTGLH